MRVVLAVTRFGVSATQDDVMQHHDAMCRAGVDSATLPEQARLTWPARSIP